MSSSMARQQVRTIQTLSAHLATDVGAGPVSVCPTARLTLRLLKESAHDDSATGINCDGDCVGRSDRSFGLVVYPKAQSQNCGSARALRDRVRARCANAGL